MIGYLLGEIDENGVLDGFPRQGVCDTLDEAKVYQMRMAGKMRLAIYAVEEVET